MADINPKAGPLSAEAFKKDIHSLHALADWIKRVPYGRNTNRSNYHMVFSENRGTCSTKHALVKAIAIENDWNEVELYMGFIRMNALNTPRVAGILSSANIAEIPEAHTYLRINDEFTDLTGINSRITEVDLEDEMEIEPDDIGMLKEVMHRGFITQWIEDENIPLSADEIWRVREECIEALGE